jgi:hypothetical protein
VIPLRPLSLGEILGATFTTLGRYWKPLLGVLLAAYGLAGAVILAMAGVAYLAFPRSQDYSESAVVALVVLVVLAALAVLAATAMVQAACPVVVQQAVLGRATTFREIWWRAATRLCSVAGIVVVEGLIALIPTALFLLGFVVLLMSLIAPEGGPNVALSLTVSFVGTLLSVPLGIWLWVRFSLASAVAVIEFRAPVDALRRSTELVGGAWWRICGISALGFLIAGVASTMIEQAGSLLSPFAGMYDDSSSSGGDFGDTPSVVLGVLVVAVTLIALLAARAIATVVPEITLNLLYVDQRLRRENLGPLLAEAAGAAPATG